MGYCLIVQAEEFPEQLLAREAISQGAITHTKEQQENHQLAILADQLNQLIRKEASI